MVLVGFSCDLLCYGFFKVHGSFVFDFQEPGLSLLVLISQGTAGILWFLLGYLCICRCHAFTIEQCGAFFLWC